MCKEYIAFRLFYSCVWFGVSGSVFGRFHNGVSPAGVTMAIEIAIAIAARSVVGMLIGVDLLTLIQIEVTFATV